LRFFHSQRLLFPSKRGIRYQKLTLQTEGTVEWYWRFRWALLDGALNLLYLLIFCSILILWRPTDNNQRYGLDQLAQDEDEYEEGLELGRMAAADRAGNAERRKSAGG
jgi:hypothetical protein